MLDSFRNQTEIWAVALVTVGFVVVAGAAVAVAVVVFVVKVDVVVDDYFYR